MTSFLTSIITLIFTSANAQNIANPKLNKVFFEDFTEANSAFPVIKDNPTTYLDYKSGNYMVIRRESNSPYAILSSYYHEMESFSVKTAFKLGPSKSKQSSIGLYTLIQPEGEGIIFEISRKRQYRVKKYLNGQYTYLTGDENKEGWVKSKEITLDDYNYIVLHYTKGFLDIYLNDKILCAVKDRDFEKGKVGMIVSPDTKAKIDYFYLYELEAQVESEELALNTAGPAHLQRQLNQLRIENDSLRFALQQQKMHANPNDEVSVTAMLQARIIELNKENQALQEEVASAGKSSQVLMTQKLQAMEAQSENRYKEVARSYNRQIDSLKSEINEIYRSKARLKFSNDSLYVIMNELKNDLEEINRINKERRRQEMDSKKMELQKKRKEMEERYRSKQKSSTPKEQPVTAPSKTSSDASPVSDTKEEPIEETVTQEDNSDHQDISEIRNLIKSASQVRVEEIDRLPKKKRKKKKSKD